jgi:plasmid stabilization system protein ParE
MEGKKEGIPKSYSVRITGTAHQHIENFTGYIAYINHQPLNATRVGEAIFDTIERIGQFPFMFRECEEIPTKSKIYRKAVCLSWLIIYRIKGKEVTILGVVHGSRRASKIRELKRIK